MLNWRSKYLLIFYLLTLSGLIFLFFHINLLEWQGHNTFGPSNIHPVGPSPLKGKQSFYRHLGQESSPEEALKESYILESIKWPGLPDQPTPTPLEWTSDPAHSFFVIMPMDAGRAPHVGDQLEAWVIINDFKGRTKSYGGDFLIARLHSPELGAAVAGQLLDHKNGSYTVIFPLLWEGSVQVEVTLVHSSEAIHYLHSLRISGQDRVFYKSVFRSGPLSETTVCNLHLPASEQPVCDYTDIKTGEPWYCYKPKQNLSCESRINHSWGSYPTNLLTQNETLLFQGGVNIKARIHARGSHSVTVLPKDKDKPSAESISGKGAPTKFRPSGYYLNWSWRLLSGVVVREFNPAAITQCLKGKQMHIYGDSTARQYYEFLTSFLPELKDFDLKSTKKAGPFLAVDVGNNIMLMYSCHSPPIAWDPISVPQLRSVADQLDGLVGGPDTVVIISVWAHFTTFPVEVYLRRIRHIQRAVMRLLDRAPETLVVVRSANLRIQNPEMSPIFSDWYSLQMDVVVKAMFRDVNVFLLDAWEMTVAHHLPQNIHPQPPIIQNMINTILSHLCPEKK
ncbi:hypothetical protein UPYG_G00261750 [Umbra pygmaea]|uniref:NXPE C-terminal domain-containing protein n=1 Tax=Umbra pygmaea TaxID=75934 RepID=A0ABD0W957_UMBPY